MLIGVELDGARTQLRAAVARRGQSVLGALAHQDALKFSNLHDAEHLEATGRMP